MWWWTVLKVAAINWSSHKDARQGAALAYYSVFSLGPIIVIAIAVAGLLFGHDAVAKQVMFSIEEMLGETGAEAVEAMLSGANRPTVGIVATILGTGTLLFAAVGVVVQLKDALNVVWEVRESRLSGFWQFARNYILSFAAVLTLGFLLLVSLLVSAGLAAAGKYASITALFFEIGKAAIGLYKETRPTRRPSNPRKYLGSHLNIIANKAITTMNSASRDWNPRTGQPLR